MGENRLEHSIKIQEQVYTSLERYFTELLVIFVFKGFMVKVFIFGFSSTCTDRVVYSIKS